MQEEKREVWVDLVKFWGILAIYVGHFGNEAGWLYQFVFTYHVPLFFFVSGFFGNSEGKYTIKEYFIKKVNTLVIPYFFLGILNIGFYVLLYNPGAREFLALFKDFGGVRSNMVCFGSMWFLPCLFLIEMFYTVLFKVFNSKGVLTIVGMMLLIVHGSLQLSENFFLSLDCVLAYFFYFALGSFLYPQIKRFVFRELSWYKRILFIVAVILSGCFAVIVYFQKDYLITRFVWVTSWRILAIITRTAWYSFVALNMIFINIVIARCWKIQFFGKLGRETLIFCGTEKIVKDSLRNVLAMVSGGVNVCNPFQAVMFSMGCLVINYFTIVKLLQRYVPVLIGKSSRR